MIFYYFALLLRLLSYRSVPNNKGCQVYNRAAIESITLSNSQINPVCIQCLVKIDLAIKNKSFCKPLTVPSNPIVYF